MAEFDKEFEGEEYEPDIVELDGEQFEIIDGLEYEGVTYLALIPYDEKEVEDEEEAEFIVLREVEENGEYYLATIDDEELSDKIGEMFLKQFETLMDDEEM